MSCNIYGIDVKPVEGVDCSLLNIYSIVLLFCGLVSFVFGAFLLLNNYKYKGNEVATWKINIDSPLEFMFISFSVLGSLLTIVFFIVVAIHSDPFIGLSVLWLILGLFGLTGWYMILLHCCKKKMDSGVVITGGSSGYRAARFEVA